MTGWRSVPVADCFLVPPRNGIHKGPAFVGSGVKRVRMGDLFAFDRITASWDGFERLSLTDEEVAKQTLAVGDLLFCRTSVAAQGVGKCSVVVDVPETLVPASNLIRIRLDRRESDPLFFFYLFSSDYGTRLLHGLTRGAAVFTITGPDIGRLEVPLPPLPTQRKIAAILSAYDDLIENNNRRIKLLEEMAQRIYREWFVDFRYPGHEHVALVESELGPIPGGWSVRSLGEVLEVLEAGTRPKGGIDPSQRGVPSIGAENVIGLGRYDFSKEKYVSEDFYNGMQRGRVADGDVVLYKDGAHIGRVSMFGGGFPHDACAVNEHVFIMRSNERLCQSLLYFWLADPGNQERVRALNANSAQPGLNQDKLRKLTLVVAASDVVRKFEYVVAPLIRHVLQLALLRRRCQLTRDLLLPRLISGAIDVENLDITMPDLAA